MYRSHFSGHVFDDLDRIQQHLQQMVDWSTPSIRGHVGGFPAVNVGQTADSTEIYAFVPGVEPTEIDVTVDRGVLSISGQRIGGVVPATAAEGELTVHGNERFAGRFRRVVSLPDDSDPASVQARCRDGVLQVSVKRREAAKPRRVDVQ